MRASMLIYAALFLAGYGVRATIDCDESLIAGATNEFTFAAATKELACNDGKEIVYGFNVCSFSQPTAQWVQKWGEMRRLF